MWLGQVVKEETEDRQADRQTYRQKWSKRRWKTGKQTDM